MSEYEPPKHLWPLSLRRIASWCGDDVALKLWEAFGGTRLYVPCVIEHDCVLVSVIGLPAANRLSEVCGGETLLIGRAHKAILVMRNFMIRKQRREGKSLAELARHYQLTDRQIMTICNKDDLIQPSRNCDIFAVFELEE